MKKILTIALTASIMQTLNAQNNFASADLTNRFANLPAHPRLGHITENGFPVASAPDFQPYINALTNEARKILALPAPEHKKIGRRLLTVSRETLRRLTTLSAAYRITR
ncbi:MAG: hypothetical protein FWG05_02205, partial [Kiritimatiellaeota bacterium]|nr:hypothetical protein [Kiritimatiellota bacterium]